LGKFIHEKAFFHFKKSKESTKQAEHKKILNHITLWY